VPCQAAYRRRNLKSEGPNISSNDSVPRCRRANQCAASVVEAGRLGQWNVVRRDRTGHAATIRTTLVAWRHMFEPRWDCWVRKGSCPIQRNTGLQCLRLRSCRRGIWDCQHRINPRARRGDPGSCRGYPMSFPYAGRPVTRGRRCRPRTRGRRSDSRRAARRGALRPRPPRRGRRRPSCRR
jgi:hypothetical protein